jgi:FkbM family methyltransferase
MLRDAQSLVTKLPRHIGGLLRQWREMRSASAQWPRWMLRRLLLPIHSTHFVITSRTGARHALGDDATDDAVFKHLHGYGRELYFPPVVPNELEGVILDVGAHHGIYAIEAVRRYTRSSVIAIEPDPAACRAIEASAALNNVASRVEIVAAGLAESDGPGWLLCDREGSWAYRTTSDSPPAVARIEIALKRLESILRGRRPVIVKCNAEGAEFTLVPQLIALGCRPQLIVLMIHPEAGLPQTILPVLAGAGYRVVDADHPPLGCRFHCFLI